MTATLRPSDVVAAPGLLLAFNRAGVLAPIDVHAAATIGRLLGDADEETLLAAALAVRATRFGHVRLELGRVRDTVVVDGLVEGDVAALPWPDPEDWPRRLAASPLTGPGGPLVLDGDAVYLARYRDYEARVLALLHGRFGAPAHPAGPLAEAIDPIVPAHRPEPGEEAEADRQRVAVALAQVRPLLVVAGGPGTGKTWTICRIAAAAFETARLAGRRAPEVALAAPTGKAAARATEQVHDAVAALRDAGVADDTLGRLGAVEGSTIHRLLGWHPERGRFRHDAASPLPYDLVVVDETSMVSLSLMTRLLEAVRPDARVVLVGDPDQLTSIEAGSVLGDVVGPAADGLLRLGAAAAELAPIVGPVPEAETAAGGIGDGVVVLRRPRRFGEGSPIALLAAAVRAGDPDAAIQRLDGAGIDWHPVEGAVPDEVPDLVAAAEEQLAALLAAGRAGDPGAALDVVRRRAVLCAHRRGPQGVEAWTRWAEQWMRSALGAHVLPLWYPGRPVMVTANDYRLNLFNGDIGVTVRTGDGLRVAFDDAAGPRLVAPTRLAAVDSVYAMTIHKAQGSEFAHAVVVLPAADSPLATRELVYTAVTRARERLTVVGTADALTAALARRVARASGLREGLWGRGE
jgi:exodeoxyribonuclease V alpha subunit